MFFDRIKRPVAATVLVTFGALVLQPLSALAQDRPPSAASRRVAETAEEKFSRTLNEIHDLLKEVAPQTAMPHMVARKKGETELRAIGPNMKIEAEPTKPLPGVDVAARVSQLRSKAKELASLEQHIRAGFDETARHIKEKNLPAEILARHDEALKAYETRAAEFKALVAAVERAADAGGVPLQTALNDLAAFMAKYPAARKETPTDPSRLPWRTAKPVTRAPHTSPWQFHTSQLFGGTLKLAQAGSLSGIGLPSAVPPVVPQPADTAATEDVQITQTVIDLAASLDSNPVKIYNWVRNNIEFSPTYGSVQGSELTLQNRRGNAFDTASLLIALLRSAKIPARYVYGTVEVPATQVMNWLGIVTGPRAAVELMASSGIPAIGVAQGGQVSAIRFEHVWVEAYVDYVPSRGAVNRTATTWVPLDASFKQYSTAPGIDVGTAVPLDAAALLSAATSGATIDTGPGRFLAVNAGAMAEMLADYNRRVDVYLRQNHPDATFETGFGRRIIQAQQTPILLGTLPYRTVAVGQRFAAMPATLRMGLTLRMYASETDAALDNPAVSFQTSLPNLGIRRLGVTFVPAGPGDEATLNNAVADPNVAQLPAYLINVKPEVRIDGQKQAEGVAGRMGTDQIWEFTLITPGGSPASHRFTATSGSELVFGVTGDGVSRSAIKKRMDTVPSESAAENLHQMALHYWFEQDFFSRLQAAREKVGYQLQSAFGLFSSPLTVTASFFGVSRAAAYLGREMDVAHLLVSVAAQDAAQRFRFGRLISIQGSLLEGAVPEQLFGRAYGQGVSAVRLLSNANEQKIPIYVLTPGNADSVIPVLQVSAEVKQNIQNAVFAGRTVVVSERAPQSLNWQGVGYILEDPVDGTGAYLISGGLNGMALPDCACEKVKVPKTQKIFEILATIIILAMLAALIAGSGGVGGVAAPAALAGLMLLFGLSALAFPVSAQASSTTPPACCITAECGKPDLYRGGRGQDANLQRIRLNWTNQRTLEFLDGDVGYRAGPIPVPPQTTCDTASLVPGLAESITVVGGSGGASHDEVPGNVSTPIWRLPKDTFPPPQLCMVHDGVPRPTHWSLMPRQDMSFKEFCDLLRGFNPAYSPFAP